MSCRSRESRSKKGRGEKGSREGEARYVLNPNQKRLVQLTFSANMVIRGFRKRGFAMTNGITCAVIDCFIAIALLLAYLADKGVRGLITITRLSAFRVSDMRCIAATDPARLGKQRANPASARACARTHRPCSRSRRRCTGRRTATPLG